MYVYIFLSYLNIYFNIKVYVCINNSFTKLIFEHNNIDRIQLMKESDEQINQLTMTLCIRLTNFNVLMIW